MAAILGQGTIMINDQNMTGTWADLFIKLFDPVLGPLIGTLTSIVPLVDNVYSLGTNLKNFLQVHASYFQSSNALHEPVVSIGPSGTHDSALQTYHNLFISQIVPGYAVTVQNGDDMPVIVPAAKALKVQDASALTHLIGISPGATNSSITSEVTNLVINAQTGYATTIGLAGNTLNLAGNVYASSLFNAVPEYFHIALTADLTMPATNYNMTQANGASLVVQNNTLNSSRWSYDATNNRLTFNGTGTAVVIISCEAAWVTGAVQRDFIFVARLAAANHWLCAVSWGPGDTYGKILTMQCLLNNGDSIREPFFGTGVGGDILVGNSSPASGRFTMKITVV